MSTVKILYLADSTRLSGSVPVLWNEDHKEQFETRVGTRHYVSTSESTLQLAGVDAAEEVYDLTNNPNRRVECKQLLGHSRPVHPGDIVVVDGVMHGCLTIGWVQLEVEL